MVNTLRRIGTPLERLARETGSSLADVDSPSELIPERPWWNLIELAARREGIPDLGLRIAASMPFDEIETIAATVRNCGTLGELLALFCRIAPLQT